MDEGEGDENKKTKPITLKNFTEILMKLDNEAAHTSFGKLPLSKEGSAPQFGIPQAKKSDGEKVFLNEELAKTVNACKHSPGPAMYEVREPKNKYKNAPGWGFGTSSRMGESKAKYDFYENDRFLDDPIEADNTRKTKCLAPKIGTEPRFASQTLEKNPGPQYYPGEKPNKKKAPKYSMGLRRNNGNQNGLQNQTATPGNVGPGRYVPESCVDPSNKKTAPKWTLPKAGRPQNDRRRPDKN